MVISALSHAGFSPNISDNDPQLTLSNAPSAVVYHMVCNLQILQDSRILSIIRAHSPSDLLPGWPVDPPPAGMLILLVDENPRVRQWAKNQASKCKIVPIPKEKFVGPYAVALEAIAHAVSAGTDLSSSATLAVPTNNTAIATSNAFRIFSYTTDPADLWSGFCAFLRLIPPKLLTSSTNHNVDLRRLVTGHLHDTGPRQ
jgi:senataxin